MLVKFKVNTFLQATRTYNFLTAVARQDTMYISIPDKLFIVSETVEKV